MKSPIPLPTCPEEVDMFMLRSLHLLMLIAEELGPEGCEATGFNMLLEKSKIKMTSHIMDRKARYRLLRRVREMSIDKVENTILRLILRVATMPKNTPKNITQIATDNDRIFALCADGTLWMMDTVDPTRHLWEQLPEISKSNEVERNSKPHLELSSPTE